MLGDLIPTRQKVGKRQAGEIAKTMVDKLMASWGLGNASRIIKQSRVILKAERTRRKSLDKPTKGK